MLRVLSGIFLVESIPRSLANLKASEAIGGQSQPKPNHPAKMIDTAWVESARSSHTAYYQAGSWILNSETRFPSHLTLGITQEFSFEARDVQSDDSTLHRGHHAQAFRRQAEADLQAFPSRLSAARHFCVQQRSSA